MMIDRVISHQMPSIAKAIIGLFITGLTLGSSGCGAPKPAAEFVQMSQHLHDGSLASAIVPNGDLTDYVDLLGQRLIDAAKLAAPGRTADPMFARLRFHLVDSDVVNAFTTGGPHVYVYAGLFQFCEGEEELAVAMAHAYAHAVRLDVQQMKRMETDPDQIMPLAAYGFVINRFTEGQERDADRLAFAIYTRAGYDPARFENLFQRLRDAYPAPPAPDRPSLVSRADVARAIVRGVPRSWRKLPVADGRTFAGLKRQSRAIPDAADDPNFARLYLAAFPNCILPTETPDQLQAQQRLTPPPPPPARLEPN